MDHMDIDKESVENIIKCISKSDIQNKRLTDFSFLFGNDINNDYYNANVVDANTSRELEQAYLDGTLKQVGLIDTGNFPQDVTDKKTCALLDELVSKNQIPFRECRYHHLNYITDVFKEYSLDGRKFVKIQAHRTQDETSFANGEKIESGREYWIEVKPISNERIYVPDHQTRKR